MYTNYKKNKTEFELQKINVQQNKLIFENKCNDFKDYLKLTLVIENMLVGGRGFLSYSDFDFEQYTYFFAIDFENKIFIFDESRFEFDSIDYDLDENILSISTLVGDFTFINCRIEESPFLNK